MQNVWAVLRGFPRKKHHAVCWVGLMYLTPGIVFQPSIFRGELAVSFREGIQSTNEPMLLVKVDWFSGAKHSLACGFKDFLNFTPDPWEK